jgi:DNA-binding CsgD family transcriptional regulator
MTLTHKNNEHKVDVRKVADILTEKQLDVLCCLLFGLSYKETGRALNISNRTVEGHLREIALKTGLENKKEIIANIALLKDSSLYQRLEKRFHAIKMHQSVSFSSGSERSFFRFYKTGCIITGIVLSTVFLGA